MSSPFRNSGRHLQEGAQHGPSAHVIILTGDGYSLMWREGEEPRRYDWESHADRATQQWFHQHFNTGPTPARYSPSNTEVALIPQCAGRAHGLDQPDASAATSRYPDEERASATCLRIHLPAME